MCSIFVAQLTGASLYWINREWYYAYMAMTKRYFAITTTVMTQLWGPVTVRISGNDSVAGQIHQLEDGGVKFDFPERVVLIANHQVSLLDKHSQSIFRHLARPFVQTERNWLTRASRSTRIGCTSGG